MKNTISKHTETLKKSVDSASQSSKETIKALIDTNTKQFGTVLDANKKTFDAISKLLRDKEVDPAFLSTIKNSFTKSVQLSEDVIDTVIDSHCKRIDQAIDFVTRFMDILKNEDMTSKEGTDKLLELAKENMESSTNLTMQNIEKMIQAYSEHLNLALAFNRKFAENVQSYANSMMDNHSKNKDNLFPFPYYGDFAFDWWKKGEEKEKTKA